MFFLPTPGKPAARHPPHCSWARMPCGAGDGVWFQEIVHCCLKTSFTFGVRWRARGQA